MLKKGDEFIFEFVTFIFDEFFTHPLYAAIPSPWAVNPCVRAGSQPSVKLRHTELICVWTVVTGDWNDGPGRDLFERSYLTRNVADIVLGSTFTPALTSWVEAELTLHSFMRGLLKV